MPGKKDLVEAVANSADAMSKAAVADIVDATLEGIAGMLVDGEKLSLPGFGTFSVSQRKARDGRNPATGATIHIPAKKVVKFKPAKALADAVNH